MQNQSFNGGVFSDALPGGRAGAMLTVDSNGIHAQVQNEIFTVAPSDWHFEIGGASGHMIFCRNQARTLTLFCEDKQFTEQLLAQFSHPDLSAIAGRLKKQKQHRLLGTSIFLGMMVAAVLSAPLLWKPASTELIHLVPFSVDQKIGDLAVQSMDLGGPRFRDPEVQQAVEVIVARLAPFAPMPEKASYDVRVIDHDIPNAFALPGGHIIVYTGLIEKATSPEQVAGVIAHEMTHVVERHGLERMVASLGIVATVQLFLGDVVGVLALGKELMTLSAVNHYSRGQESSADKGAVKIMHQAHLNPHALAEFFAILEKDDSQKIGEELNWLSSHPALKKRMRAIDKWNKKLGDNTKELKALDLDWPSVTKHLKPQEQEPAWK